MKLEYEYYNEWKELKKQKNYEDASKSLKNGIKYNLARAHNYYSDLKINAEYGNTHFGTKYGMNKQGKLIQEMQDFIYLKINTIGRGAYYDEMEWEDDEKYNPKDKLKDYEKLQSDLIKLFKKRFV